MYAVRRHGGSDGVGDALLQVRVSYRDHRLQRAFKERFASIFI